METKYCSYNIIAPKGKRTTSRRSCKKTNNPSENSDLCEVLNKRCGLKENHDRRVYQHAHSKKVSPKKRVQRKSNVAKRPAVVELPVAPKKVQQRPAVVELPVEVKKVQQRPAVVEEAPVAVKQLISPKSPDIENYEQIVNELRKKGNSEIYYSGDYERYLGAENEQEKKMFEYKKELFEQIKKQYGDDIINIEWSGNNSGSMYWERYVISVKPDMVEEFNSML
jgi:hypothetical protein